MSTYSVLIHGGTYFTVKTCAREMRAVLVTSVGQSVYVPIERAVQVTSNVGTRSDGSLGNVIDENFNRNFTMVYDLVMACSCHCEHKREEQAKGSALGVKFGHLRSRS